MRDDKAGAVEHEIVEGLLNHVFGFGIKGAGGLVQNEQRRILEQGAGNGQALFLAAGKTHAAFSDGRFVPLGQLADEAVGIGGHGCGTHAIHVQLRGQVTPVSDVFGNGHVEQEGILRHHRYGTPQGRQRVLLERLAVQKDLAALRIIEAGDQVDERSLARAGRPHEGDALPGLYRKRNAPERGRALIAVVQAHVTEGQLAERLVQRQRASAFGLEGRIVEDGEHALGPGKGVLHVHVRAVQTLEGRIQHGKRAHEGEERARRHIALDDLAAAVPDHQPDADRTDEFHHRGRQLGHAGLAEVDVDDPGVFLVEAPRFLLFGREGLDDPDTAEQFLQHAGDTGVHLGILAPVPPQGPAEQRQREPGDGQDDDGPARQFEILLEHHVQQADHGDHLPDDLYERGQALPDHAHVVDDARHERPDLRFLIEMQGQGDDFLK